MKYGLLYYKDTDNIGDDIQTYAQERFLPRVDYLIDRENLELFVPDKKEKVKLIMNAWYIHDIFNFNISPYIEPLYISMFLLICSFLFHPLSFRAGHAALLRIRGRHAAVGRARTVGFRFGRSAALTRFVEAGRGYVGKFHFLAAHQRGVIVVFIQKLQ